MGPIIHVIICLRTDEDLSTGPQEAWARRGELYGICVGADGESDAKRGIL